MKTAFVKALQQEQEIEQRMASQGSSGAADYSIHSPASQQQNQPSVTIQPQHSVPRDIAISPAPVKTPTNTPRMQDRIDRIERENSSRPAPTPPNNATPPPSHSSSRSSSRNTSAAAAAAAAAANDPMSSMSFAAQLNALSSLASLGNFGNLGSLANMGNFGNSSQAAAAMQAFQQQLFRGTNVVF